MNRDKRPPTNKDKDGNHKLNSFKTHGVNEKSAIDYLETSDGRKLLKALKNFDKDAPASELMNRAIGQLMSGRELPRMEIIDEPLTKIVPVGEKVSPYSPYFSKQSEFETTLAQGHRLN
ncbi:hypothetical protein, partial [Solilutibacter pythonis]|uniref:hypothetical protein n=1 Tax=Solilutibacter pythonis TaxID=2483112 RepID=UPI001B88070D